MTLKKALFVPGFCKTKTDIIWAREAVKKMNIFFNPHGWEIIMSGCYEGNPSSKKIFHYGKKVAQEVVILKPDAIIAFSMGVTILRSYWDCAGFEVPKIMIEGPNEGAPAWKLLLMFRRYPLTRRCIRDIVPWSRLMRFVKRNSTSGKLMEIQGKFSQWWLAKKVYKPFPQTNVSVMFPTVGHRALLTDPRAHEAMLRFLE